MVVVAVVVPVVYYIQKRVMLIQLLRGEEQHPRGLQLPQHLIQFKQVEEEPVFQPLLIIYREVMELLHFLLLLPQQVVAEAVVVCVVVPDQEEMVGLVEVEVKMVHLCPEAQAILLLQVLLKETMVVLVVVLDHLIILVVVVAVTPHLVETHRPLLLEVLVELVQL